MSKHYTATLKVQWFIEVEKDHVKQMSADQNFPNDSNFGQSEQPSVILNFQRLSAFNSRF